MSAMWDRKILEAIGISKSFGNVVALEDVSLGLRRGSVHALLGENGAGKSTLVKCIMGFYQPDTGDVLFGDREQKITNPQNAVALGIGMVYQHFTLIPNMTVAENIVLARPKLPRVINWRQEMTRLKRRMEGMPFQIPLDASVSDLAAGEKQKVEITKQLLLDVKVLILDEPTSVLTPNEAEEVLGKIKKMTRDRGLSVLIITHKFREVMRFADEVTVLRRGRHVGTTAIANATPQSLAELMVGKQTAAAALQRREIGNSLPVLEVRGLSVSDDKGAPAVANASLTVRSGEIVGIAGVSGNGQCELVQVLAGQRAPQRGNIWIGGERYVARRDQIDRQKVRCLPEEPLRNACVPNMSVAENMALRTFDRPPHVRGRWWLDRASIRRSAQSLIERFKVRPDAPDANISALSGGNVQRAVLARELSEQVNLLVVANPCFGLDFSAVAEIHEHLINARNRGTAVLLISEDLDEILELSDRVLVMANGELVYETIPASADLGVIGQHMAGH